MTDNHTIFETIYKTNRWGSSESVSGRGSELRQTGDVQSALRQVIGNLGVQTMIDTPCGDFNWMPHVLADFPDVKYTGFEIVDELVTTLREKYEDHPTWSFQQADITECNLPAADLVVCRDCLVHLTTQDATKALANFIKSGSRYLLSTHYPRESLNSDTQNGHWRPVNLRLAPFLLPEYVQLFDTDFIDNGRNHPGNHLGLWDLEAVRSISQAMPQIDPLQI